MTFRRPNLLDNSFRTRHVSCHLLLLLRLVLIAAASVRSNATFNTINKDHDGLGVESSSLLPPGWTSVDTTTTNNTYSTNVPSSYCSVTERIEHPVLCHMLDRLVNDAENLAEDVHDWAERNGLLVGLQQMDDDDDDNDDDDDDDDDANRNSRLGQVSPSSKKHRLPVVLAHGMGDSCFNSGMQSITALVSKLLDGVSSACIPIGATQAEDTTNGYFLNMDASVVVFAQAVQNDELFRGGFHAVGFSQGNNVIRGYIAKYNDPPVHTFISVNGVNAGVGAVPYCIPKSESSEDRGEEGWNTMTTTTTTMKDMRRLRQRQQKHQQSSRSSVVTLPSMCDLLMEQASKRAYTEFSQQHLFQANYWRDPRKSAWPMYQKYSQLAVWNNEHGSSINETLKMNWSKTTKFVWIMAQDDGMVWPKEGEQWGAPNSQAVDPFNAPVLARQDTDWYQHDLFGLRTAEEAGKNIYESFPGDHLQFTTNDFKRWITTYLTDDVVQQPLENVVSA